VVDRKKDMLLVGGENVYTTEVSAWAKRSPPPPSTPPTQGPLCFLILLQVEAVLHLHPAVNQAAVFGVENRVMGELVAAAVQLKGGAVAAPRELIAWCRQRLAEYKVPSAVHIVEEFPKTGGRGAAPCCGGARVHVHVACICPKREDAFTFILVLSPLPPFIPTPLAHILSRRRLRENHED
jgi:hypothetical protein